MSVSLQDVLKAEGAGKGWPLSVWTRSGAFPGSHAHHLSWLPEDRTLQKENIIQSICHSRARLVFLLTQGTEGSTLGPGHHTQPPLWGWKGSASIQWQLGQHTAGSSQAGCRPCSWHPVLWLLSCCSQRVAISPTHSGSSALHGPSELPWKITITGT